MDTIETQHETQPNNPRRVAVHTLGCKVNQYDTEAVLQTFRQRGYQVVDFDKPADVYIINTCTVTNVGDKKSRQLIRRAIRQNPAAVVCAMGCYAQVASAELAEIPGLDLVVGTQRRAEVVDLVEEELRAREGRGRGEVRVTVEQLSRTSPFEEFAAGGLAERTRATVKIQEGCAQFCSYCKVPYARGPERSRDPRRVHEEVRRLAAEGYREIVLTGIHLGSYGRDRGGPSLAAIAREVAGVDGIYRVRLSSVEPNDVTPELIELVATNPRLCRHFHLPLQSGSDAVLGRMRRRYDRRGYASVVEAIRTRLPEAALTTDVIVGFPGETDADFADTVAFAREMRFSRMHVFPYSRRAGTPAATFPGQVPAKIKSDRVTELIAVGEELAAAFHQTYVGREVEVLFEEEDGGGAVGLTDTYVRVVVPQARNLAGQVARVLITDAGAEEVTGEFRGD